MDDLLSRVTIDPLAIKYPSRGDTASAGLAGETTVSDCLGNLDGRATALDGRATALDGRATALDGRVTALDGRVTALESAPAGGLNYDVTVVTALGAANVGKVVRPTARPFTTGSTVVIDDGAVSTSPVGVLLSVDGSGGGVVRCFGEAPCRPDSGSVDGLVVSKADGSGKVGGASTGSGKVVGRMLTNNGMMDPGTMFVTAMATVGLTAV